MSKKTLGTLSLAGCFGCHMSLLDIDLDILELEKYFILLNSPLTDIKHIQQRINIGLIEGGVCNDHNVHKLIEFRKNCDILVSMGECAIMGGLPALRNNIEIQDCLQEAYINGPSIKEENHQNIIPAHEDIPKILDKVYPCHEVVKIDYFIPGCPPSSDSLWCFFSAMIEGREPQYSYEQIKYD